MRAIDFFKRRAEALRTSGPALVVMPDGAPHLHSVKGALAELGLRTDVLHAARAALATMDRSRPSLVVYSARLPDMDGASFHAAVQRRSGGRRIPTLAIMPSDRTPDQYFGRQTGIMEYICAPFRPENLASRLQALLPHVKGAAEPAPVEKVVENSVPAAESASVEPMETPASAAEPDPTAEPASSEPAPVEPAPVEEPVTTVEPTSAPAPVQEPEPSEPAAAEAPRSVARNLKLPIQVVGLGEWGGRVAEIFAARGMDAAAHELDSEAWLEETFATEADLFADLFIVAADLAGQAGSRIPASLRRLNELAPRAGRLVIARLPGNWSGPDERALGLVALNAVLQAPPSGVFLVQQEGELIASGGRSIPGSLTRLLEIFDAARGRGGEPLLETSRSMLVRHFGTPGFVGWREIELAEEMCAAEAPGWHGRLAAEQAGWQPEGFAWDEAQAVLPFVRAPRSWIEEGGRVQFVRLVRAAWDEAAPCVLAPALYGGEHAVAVLVSAGVPYPRGVLALRDSVETDRPRLAEKRRAAGALIPLAEGFLSSEAVSLGEPEPAVAEAGEAEVEAEGVEVEAEEEEGVEEAEEAGRVELEPGPAVEPVGSQDATVDLETVAPTETVAAPQEVAPPAAQFTSEPEFAPEPATETEPEPAPETEPGDRIEAETTASAAGPVEPVQPVEPAEPVEPVEPAEPGTPSAPDSSTTFAPAVSRSVYRRALALVRGILKASNPRAEIDLGGIRYVVYDILESVREDPESMLEEVFRPVAEDYFERHHVNVAVLAILVGERLDEPLSSVIDLGTSAMLHDIGMSETREIWDRDTRLPTALFDRAIRHHPRQGHRRLQEVSGMTGEIARMVLEEHERMDGTGYPEGMSGEAIDRGARVLAVCDTLEALSHPRPYRNHLSPTEALSRLQDLARFTLDPEIVDAIVDALDRLVPASGLKTDGA
ncbi:MAG TPA: HD domain-containing phosphohydrolase [Gemmatimonadota bacterium]|nr:HD domain-containing phosphohydrolase [Gemmatimonadota bacterium]